MEHLFASYDIPWPNTETYLVLVCRDIKPKDTYGVNEFIYDKKICRWTIVVKKSDETKK